MPELDQDAVNLARAIRQTESGGDFNARGGSGEFGAYQWTEPTWNAHSAKHLGRAVPFGNATPEEQNQVAYKQVKEWKDAGYNVGQIASMWNAGAGRPNAYLEGNSGVNQFGVKYDTGGYAKNVATAYQKIKSQHSPLSEAHIESPEAPTGGLPTYGAYAPLTDSDTLLSGTLKTVGNIPSSAVHLLEGIANIVMNPLDTIEGVARTAIGAGERGIGALTGQQFQDQNVETFDRAVDYLKQRYGGSKELLNTIVNDPTGIALDLATIFEGGGAVLKAGKFTNAGEAVSGVGEVINPIRIGARGAQSVISKVGDAMEGLRPTGLSGVAEAEMRTGVRLPVSGVTESPLIRQAEAVASQGLGGERIMARAERAGEDIRAFADDVVSKASSAVDLAEAGRMISGGLEKATQMFKEQQAQIFGQIREKLGDITASTDNAVSAMRRVAKSKEDIGNAPRIGNYDLEKKVEVLLGGKEKPTLNTLRSMLDEVDDMLKTAYTDPEIARSKRDLFVIRGAIKDSIYKTIERTGSSEAMQFYRQAENSYAEGAKKIFSGVADRVRKMAKDGNYQKLAEDLLKPTTSVEDIGKIMQLVGEEGRSAIRQGVMSGIMKRATNADYEFTPQGMAREIKKFNTTDGKSRLEAVLTQEQYQALQDIQVITRALGDASRIAKGSQTAFLVKTMMQTGALGAGVYSILTGDIATGAKILAGVMGSEGASIFIASDKGQQMLRNALKFGDEVKSTATQFGYQPSGGTMGSDEAGNVVTPRSPNSGGNQSDTGGVGSDTVRTLDNGGDVGTPRESRQASQYSEVKGYSDLTESNQKVFDEMMSKAPEAKKFVDDYAQSLADKYNGRIVTADIKGAVRALQKINADYSGDPTRIGDLARNTIIVKSPEDIQAVLKDIESSGNKDVVAKYTSSDKDEMGYSGANIKMVTPQGIKAETQVNTPEMIYLKMPEKEARLFLSEEEYNSIKESLGVEGGLGHKYYEEWRNIQDTKKSRALTEQEDKTASALAQKSKDYYNVIGRKVERPIINQ